MEKQSRRSVPSWIWDFAGQHRTQYVLSVLSAVCGVVCGILPYFVMAGIISDLLGGCRDMSIYIKNCLVMAVLWLGHCGFHSISTTLSHKATFAVLGTIRKRVCAKLSRVPLGTVLDIPSGSIKNVLVERIDSIETTMAHIIPAGAYRSFGVFVYSGLADGVGGIGNGSDWFWLLCPHDP